MKETLEGISNQVATPEELKAFYQSVEALLEPGKLHRFEKSSGPLGDSSYWGREAGIRPEDKNLVFSDYSAGVSFETRQGCYGITEQTRSSIRRVWTIAPTGDLLSAAIYSSGSNLDYGRRSNWDMGRQPLDKGPDFQLLHDSLLMIEDGIESGGYRVVGTRRDVETDKTEMPKEKAISGIVSWFRRRLSR